MTRLVFHRDFRRLTGGHVKVADYVAHTRAAPGWEAVVWLAPGSAAEGNPFLDRPREVVRRRRPPDGDVLFLAGLDWRHVPRRRAERRPVVNLVQHVRHADPADPRHVFLSRPALRVCVSDEVRDAVLASGVVNGPVVTIANGVDLGSLTGGRPWADRTRPLTVFAAKAPDLGRALVSRLGRGAALVDRHVPRLRFLSLLADTRVAVVLPRPTEGFFLPALEALALGCVVVCPDCVGNRSFCVDGVNAFRPALDLDALADAAQAACDLDAATTARVRMAAAATAAEHSLERERARFHEVLAGLR